MSEKYLNIFLKGKEQLRIDIQQWFDKYSDKIDYKMGKELEEILSEWIQYYLFFI